MPDSTPPPSTRLAWSTRDEAIALLISTPILRRSIIVAIIVGTLLSVINQLSVVTTGNATGATWVRIAANYAIPFVVSCIGALSGLKAVAPGGLPAPGDVSD
jgi:hypothetical protein